jgi:hypothetical protein
MNLTERYDSLDRHIAAGTLIRRKWTNATSRSRACTTRGTQRRPDACECEDPGRGGEG